MAATSKHYSDVYKWIDQIIESCETHHQLNTAEKLISHFDKYLVDYVNPDYAHELTYKLRVSVKKREIDRS